MSQRSSTGPTEPVGNGARANPVITLLATLPVKGRAPKTGYQRALFGPAWTDDVTVQGGHNGCDTRNDILRRDLDDVTVKSGSNGCTVLSGVLHDPYTGKAIDFTRGQATSAAVQIDHVVALLDAWQKGAQGLSKQQRENLANDPLNLQAVDGPTNESKGAGDAATWLPPNKAYRCTYVSRQVRVKAKYRLWVTVAERYAILRVLGTCGGTASGAFGVPTLSAGPTATGSRTGAPRSAPASTAPTVDGGCHPLSNGGNCYKVNEFCATRYRGTDGIDAFGEPITCIQDGGYWRWVRR